MKNILIIQNSLRGFFFNYGKKLKSFTFVNKFADSFNSKTKIPPDFYSEVSRVKSSGLNKFRRISGLINIRPYYTHPGDLIFTYGCALITNKPYCICVENGLAVFNYDLKLSQNIIAKTLFTLSILDPHLKKLIFLSQAAKESFFSTVKIASHALKVAETKSEVCFPITGRQTESISIKKISGRIKFLFVGSFYMKGGLEICNTVNKLNNKYSHLFNLTIVTQLKHLREKDLKQIKSISNIKLINADLNEETMNKLFQESDVFVYPTYRDSFGLVILEAISWGLPVIGNDQFATSEMVANGVTGFLYPNHPLKDYDPISYQILGKYYDPIVFYNRLFDLQSKGKLKHIEDFIYKYMEKFILDAGLLLKMKRKTANYYKSKFHYLNSRRKIETVFENAVSDA